jgi:hypothetical protein
MAGLERAISILNEEFPWSQKKGQTDIKIELMKTS